MKGTLTALQEEILEFVQRHPNPPIAANEIWRGVSARSHSGVRYALDRLERMGYLGHVRGGWCRTDLPHKGAIGCVKPV
jgi:Fe2+ or Zn2+ uptake regulation protein